MKHFLLTLCAALFVCQTLKAQATYTDRLRQAEAGKGTIVINHTAEIDRIVNGIAQTTSKSKTSSNPTINKPQHTIKTETNTPVSTNHPSKNIKTDEKKTEAKPTPKHETASSSTTYISRARHKARGFRICIFTGGNSRTDKIKAIEMGNKCRNKFKELAAYTSFESPRWVTHVGDFRTRQEAQKYVNLIRRAHISYEVRIVASEVNVPY